MRCVSVRVRTSGGGVGVGVGVGGSKTGGNGGSVGTTGKSAITGAHADINISKTSMLIIRFSVRRILIKAQFRAAD